MNFAVGLVACVGYLVHLIIDMSDNANFYPLYPFKKYNIKGPVKYNSRVEMAITALMFAVFFFL